MRFCFLCSPQLVSLLKAWSIQINHSYFPYLFDELSSQVVKDHSQYKNHGELVGNPTLVDGKFGKALKFNGRNDWVEIPHDDSLTVDTSVTVMVWIKTPRHGGPRGALWQAIVAKGNDPRSYSFYTCEQSRGVHLSVGDFQGGASARNILLNRWQHVVAQFDNGMHRYWINGKPTTGSPIAAASARSVRYCIRSGGQFTRYKTCYLTRPALSRAD